MMTSCCYSTAPPGDSPNARMLIAKAYLKFKSVLKGLNY